MKIDFYFDPSCPFSWITSRLIKNVEQDRKLDVSWRPFSLAIKNDDFNGDGERESIGHIASHRVLRVMLAATEGGASMDGLYTSFGTQKHIIQEPYSDEIIAKVLADLKLPADLINRADDTSLDGKLSESISSATDIVGDDVGVPIIVFTLPDGSQSGYFGPVLESLPDKEACLSLWDGLAVLATSPDFYELKRERPSGMPDTGSTARC